VFLKDFVTKSSEVVVELDPEGVHFFSTQKCFHPKAVRLYSAQWVYGTPGWTYARYRCPECKWEWDFPDERPNEGPVWWGPSGK